MTWINRNSILILVITLLSPFVNNNIVLAAEKQAGKTLLTLGKVISKRSGSEITLKRRSNIFENDEIHVGKSGRAQFRMIDKAIISLQENSVLQIKEYRYKTPGKPDSSLLELLSGGLRTITGAIGKGNKKAYELRTPLATIGIRGTDYEVEIVSNGMYVAVWEGVIHLRARVKNRCNILLGRSQPFMFIFIDQLGRCNGLDSAPEVFKNGHSSNIPPRKITNKIPDGFIAGSTRLSNPPLEPLLQLVQDGIPPLMPPLVIETVTPDPEVETEVPETEVPEIETPETETPEVSINHSAFVIDQSQVSKELDAKSSTINSSTPKFSVGLNLLENVPDGTLENFQQSVGGYSVSWGYWGEFSSSLKSKNINNSTENGLIWATYEASDPSVVNARTGTFSSYNNLVDSIASGTSGAVSNLQVEMDVNFESGNVTNGALSANTPNDTWVAVFDGKIDSGDLDLQLNGASVIDSNPATPSPPRDVDGFIAGDFIGNNAEAIIGAFGLSENNVNTPNQIEGVFILEEK